MTIIINMDRYSLEHDDVTHLAEELRLDEEDIKAHMYNLWIDEKHTEVSQTKARQQLEDWFDHREQNVIWQDVTIIVTIARYDIDIIALRTVRAWFALKSNRIPALYWLPSEIFKEDYREFVEKNTHPGSVSLEVAPEATIVSDEEQGSRIVVKNIYTVAFSAVGAVEATADFQVNPTCSEDEIEAVALEQASKVTWTCNRVLNGTLNIESINQTGEVTV